MIFGNNGIVFSTKAAAAETAGNEFNWDAAPNQKMIIQNDGKVGIGIAPKTLFTVEGTITLKEQAAADGDTAGYGQIWVKDNAGTTELWFTTDAGADTKIV
ncbi:hypothetical protein LCGC14_3076860 [marine sediment metagenome]|uniref:Uncharacterized protein n=1 Tax=marine sediment metagenome TaxID=412755 RepID=A0A0F8YLY9_9ZZZZ